MDDPTPAYTRRFIDMTAPRELAYFLLMTPEEQEEAIRRLAASGMSDHGIASATRWNVGQIRHVIGKRAEVKP